MNKLLPLLALLLIAASPAPSSPRPWPWNVVPFPKCREPAFGADYAIKVYEAREDWERALSSSVAAAKLQAACARQTGNPGVQYNLRALAATNYSRAADLAFKLKEYSLVPNLVASSNGLYNLMLKSSKYSNPFIESDQQESILANITANNDLLKRIPRRRVP